MKTAITPTNWFYKLCIQSENKTDSNLHSWLEFAFLLDSGASISVLNLPACMMITQIFNVCNHDQHNTSKTLTIADQSEIPIKQDISVTCFYQKK